MMFLWRERRTKKVFLIFCILTLNGKIYRFAEMFTELFGWGDDDDVTSNFNCCFFGFFFTCNECIVIFPSNSFLLQEYLFRSITPDEMNRFLTRRQNYTLNYRQFNETILIWRLAQKKIGLKVCHLASKQQKLVIHCRKTSSAGYTPWHTRLSVQTVIEMSYLSIDYHKTCFGGHSRFSIPFRV